MDEKRTNTRRRILKGAKIVLNDGYSVITCTVRNLSADGALLRVSSVLGIPATFTLLLDDGTKRRCHIARKSADEIGVRFELPGDGHSGGEVDTIDKP